MNEMKFDSLQDLNDAFTSNKMSHLPDAINIGDTLKYVYRKMGSKLVGEKNIKELADEHGFTWVAYEIHAADRSKVSKNTGDSLEQMKQKMNTPSEVLLFGWKLNGLSLIPARCVSVSRAGVVNVERVAEGEDRPVIGATIQVMLPQLSSETFEAKVDTGAGQCCLHAEQIKSSGGSVSFVFEGKRFTMNQSDSVEIQTADNGGDTRPVIKIKVRCESGEFSDVEFNLNDRSDMPHKILLGQNFLQLGNFLIDPLQEGFLDEEKIGSLLIHLLS